MRNSYHGGPLDGTIREENHYEFYVPIPVHRGLHELGPIPHEIAHLDEVQPTSILCHHYIREGGKMVYKGQVTR